MMVREATAGDALAIQRLIADELGYTVAIECLVQNIEKILAMPHDKLLVAVNDHTVVDYIHLADYTTTLTPSCKNIMALSVCQAYQRQGIGTLLLQSGEQWAKADGATLIRLNSSSERETAHRFYRKNGYHGAKKQYRFIKTLYEEE